MALRKVRKDEVAKCMKTQNEENLLIDDAKAGYHINLKRHQDPNDGDSSSSSSSQAAKDLKKISDRKFFLSTPKIFLSIDNQITL